MTRFGQGAVTPSFVFMSPLTLCLIATTLGLITTAISEWLDRLDRPHATRYRDRFNQYTELSKGPMQRVMLRSKPKE